MKHNLKITTILIVMFIVTQFIGLGVISFYTPEIRQEVINGTLQNVSIGPSLPYGMQPPEIKPSLSVPTIIIAMAIAIALIFLLMTIKATWFLRLWFFAVVVLALGITLNALLFKFSVPFAAYLALIIALPLAFFKIFKQNFLVHNLTELLIYPGIATIFIPILNVFWAVILLLAISAYDIYAVWHAGFMQKMAKFQINELKFFAGFFVPYLSKKQKKEIKKLKAMKKTKKLKTKKIKVSLAILGGGDVIFPIIVAGVVLRTLGFLPALMITLFASLALLGLFVLAKKGKFYPAMPFISAGCFVGLGIAYLIHFLA